MRKKLREIRLEKGYTQKELADLLNISRSFYTRIENGTANPTLETALKLKDVLRYEKDDIFLVTE